MKVVQKKLTDLHKIDKNVRRHSEKQISGRTITMTIDYEDVLAADSFDTLLLKED